MTQSCDSDAAPLRHTWFWWVLALAVTAWVLWMTMRPNGIVTSELLPIVRTAWAFGVPLYLVIDLAGNIVVFVPLGATLALAMKHRSWPIRVLLATALGATLSLCIELIQIYLPTRFPGVEDWLLNTVSSAIGALLACLAHTLFDRCWRTT